MNNPYTLGSIWKRRDNQRAIVISTGDDTVRAISPNDARELPYSVYVSSGRVSKSGNDSPMDLIYRDQEEIVCSCGNVVHVD